MRRWNSGRLFPTAMLLAAFVLVSCGSSGAGTIPSGTPSQGNGTLAVIPSPSPTEQAIPSVSPASLKSTYAFVRDNQLWLALRGKKPVRETSFDFAGLPNVSWHQPLWSPGDRSIAFVMNALPAGQGGGGCPAPNYGANGALYVMNTDSMQLTQLMVPTDKSDPVASSPLNGYWQYTFWEDATHLLAWYNGVIGKTSNSAGLYRYDVGSHTLARVMSPGQMGVSTLFSAAQNLPILLSMHYSNRQLYYQVVAQPFEQRSQLIIYRRSVDHPETASSKVLSMGSEAWCGSQQESGFVYPGWDVSPDGQQLAAQVIRTSAAGQPASSIQTLNIPDNSTTGLLAQLPVSVLAHDLVLTWGPDSQTIVATGEHLPDQGGPYSATLANPAALDHYSPGATGLVAWKTDSTAFVMQSTDMADVTDAAQIYLFNTGDTQGQLLLTGARDFVWG